MNLSMGVINSYTSITAFLAYCRVLKSACADGTIASEERACLAAMERLIAAALSERERGALGLTQSSATAISHDDKPADQQATRRRARAELKLHRALAEQGVLTG
ncbi:MAG: hypothetical protein ACREQX_00365 [Candidatus Binataceae bacterium]